MRPPAGFYPGVVLRIRNSTPRGKTSGFYPGVFFENTSPGGGSKLLLILKPGSEVGSSSLERL